MTRPTTLCSLWLCTALAACAGFEIQTPARFYELDEESSYDYRATSADGVVLAVREIEAPQERGSSVSFWVEAVEQRMRKVGGYALLKKQDIQTHGGLSGKQLRFGHDEGSRPYAYWVTLFVHGDKLYLLETGGSKQALEQRAPEVQAAITSFTP